MKTTAKMDELERSIDFESVGKRLLDLTESGGFRRRRTVSDLLDKVKGALLKARESGASFAALTAFFRECGIPVSEATLRQYVRAQGGSKKPRRKIAARSVAAPAAEPAAETTTAPKPFGETKVRIETQTVKDRIEESRAANAPANPDPFAPRGRGPRIADPKNL